MKKRDEMKMPKVGDRLMKVMSSTSLGRFEDKAEPCVVVYVSEPKHYYTVQFVKSGIKESYKVPNVDEIGAFKKDYKRAFGKLPRGVYVYESGALYDSVSECARALSVSPSAVSNHLHGRTKHVKGYHIYALD